MISLAGTSLEMTEEPGAQPMTLRCQYTKILDWKVDWHAGANIVGLSESFHRIVDCSTQAKVERGVRYLAIASEDTIEGRHCDVHGSGSGQ